ncbi:ephrin type-B receptor 1-B-like isoform X2 [Antedon mediterranea]|uniref:ephrin type-B receptor 1-B-like isoform X2 n=1 Tax=Antedon mediterranea TaxID=105859 RepID=UPI003AF7574B
MSRYGNTYSIWIFIYLGCIIFHVSSPNKVTLYDSNSFAGLNWDIFPPSDDIATYKGWTETGASYARKFQVCQVHERNQNNWIRLPYIQKKQANLIIVETDFTMFSCQDDGTDTDSDIVSCRETFDLYYSDVNNSSENIPQYTSPPYKKISRIAADGRFSDPLSSDEVINKATERFGPIVNNGFYLAMQDQGACMALLRTLVYYLVCPKVMMHLANFPETVTGDFVTSLVEAKGECVPNSKKVGIQDPTYQCRSDGTWTVIQGECVCSEGYYQTENYAACEACPIGTYKSEIGNGPCSPCPAKSHADHNRTTSCTCIAGYYRTESEPPSKACTAPPGPPKNLQAKVNKETSVITLSWERPSETGGRSDTKYSITCPRCPKDVHFSPSWSDLLSNEVNVSRLASYTQYSFFIYSQNAVSKYSDGDASYAVTNASTFSSVPSAVKNFEIKQVSQDSVVLRWDLPEFPNGQILDYEVCYRASSETIEKSKYYTQSPINREVQEATIDSLKPGMEYEFRVRARTEVGFGSYSEPIVASTTGLGEDDPVTIALLAGGVSAVLVIMVLCASVIILVFYKKQKEMPALTEGLVYTNGEVILPKMNGPRTYIDPKTYSDPDLAVQDFATEIEASKISIVEVIGGGEFGDVCSGYLRMPDSTTRKVAVKTLKPGVSESDKIDFLTEASIMGQFDHPNVIRLMGVVTKTRPAMIITEFIKNGALDQYLRENDGQLTITQLVQLLRGIASGMCYLAEMNFVHRDLAARNILVGEKLVCKVADFGLSRSKEEGAYETKKGGKIPIRWTSPEAISYKKFTSASDVWSYGILMWEVVSFGERPYWNWSNQDVIQAVEKGYRLPPPMDCPEALHQLMLDCWQKDRLHRPTFATIVSILERMIRMPSTLSTKARRESLTHAAPQLSKIQTVDDWLDSIKMSRYKENFADAGYFKLNEIAHLSHSDLPRLGVTLVGHQKKIMKGAEVIRLHIDQIEETLV